MQKMPKTAIARAVPLSVMLDVETTDGDRPIRDDIVESYLRGTHNSLAQSPLTHMLVSALDSTTVAVTMKDVIYGSLRMYLLASLMDTFRIDLSELPETQSSLSDSRALVAVGSVTSTYNDHIPSAD
eukprot:scaffold173700_cov21-Prasinocladus_malaysianus.AAC.1